MNLLASYLLAISFLFPEVYTGSQKPGAYDLQPVDWLLYETLDLQLKGPCYDVAFYMDDIIFLKAGEEILYKAPLIRPDPAFSNPLFTNGDISCSPAALSFSSDYSRVYYTHPVMANEQSSMEKIFESSIENGMVSEHHQLSFSDDLSRNMHPAVSMDGSLIVFSSDRNPTSGGMDLFVSHKTAEGWSEPRNLGDRINTSGHDWFPFLDKMNNLWFSSTGHSGYGGFDIFFCPFEGQGWGVPRNLGEEINSPRDELGFSIHPRKQIALFSRTQAPDLQGASIMLTLNVEALDAAGNDDPSVRDIGLYLQGMADPVSSGMTTGPQANPISVQAPEREAMVISEANPVVFRVQIISSLYENSFPTVFIEGVAYNTYEYFYLGSYRITVGEFKSLKEANAFRLLCLESGFKQAFVAAFRGDERITDPSVFKQ